MITTATPPPGTRTLAVNAAFLEDIKNDHVEFNEMLRATTAVIKPGKGARTSASGMAEILSQLRDLLAMHFALEDAIGYFDGVAAQVSPLGEEAATLQAQHQDLYLELCLVVEQAESWKYGEQDFDEAAFDELARRFQSFVGALTWHEDRERQLILDSFWLSLESG